MTIKDLMPVFFEFIQIYRVSYKNGQNSILAFMKLLFGIFCYFIFFDPGLSQGTYEWEIEKWQMEINQQLKDPEQSPLGKKEIRNFKGLDYFPIDSSYQIRARFIRTPDALPFNMPTTTDRQPVYIKFGEAILLIEGNEYTLPVYQSQTLLNTKAAEDYLFLPFTDLTNGVDSYGGGRYLDLKIPDGEFIVIDFNKAYNPLCVYNERYSCPIPPKANDLSVAINAGAKDWNKNK